jgi:hypothetical protein
MLCIGVTIPGLPYLLLPPPKGREARLEDASSSEQSFSSASRANEGEFLFRYFQRAKHKAERQKRNERNDGK